MGSFLERLGSFLVQLSQSESKRFFANGLFTGFVVGVVVMLFFVWPDNKLVQVAAYERCQSTLRQASIREEQVRKIFSQLVRISQFVMDSYADADITVQNAAELHSHTMQFLHEAEADAWNNRKVDVSDMLRFFRICNDLANQSRIGAMSARMRFAKINEELVHLVRDYSLSRNDLPEGYEDMLRSVAPNR